MDVRQSFSRRRFVGGVAAAVGALSLRSDAELLAQGQTPQFTGGDAEYDAYVKLASNENNWGPPESVMKAMNNAWKYANRYGYPDGNVVQVIADHHGVRRENILLAAGSGEVLNVMATTYLRPGLKVIGVSPSYASVFQQAANVKADAIQIPLNKDYTQNISQLIEETNRNARVIGFVYLCNPNNPTGVVIKDKDVRQLLDNIPKDMPVLLDEAYHHYVDDPDYDTGIKYVKEGRKVVVARTFSKIAALAAMRIGYNVAPPDMIREMRVYASNSVNVLAKWGAVASLQDPAAQADVKAKTISMRNNTTKALESWGYASIPSQTNFFMVSLGDRTVQAVIEEFRKKGILVGRPFPPMLNHLRVSVGTPEDMEKFIKAFKEILPQKAAATAGRG
jgi:histidinol-phosphate aminotransferase